MHDRRKYIIILLISLIGLVFIGKLFVIQLIDESYKLASQNNAVRKIVEYPYRGLIYDRHGNLITYNDPVFDITIVPREVKLKDTISFCRLIKFSKKKVIEKITEAKKYSWVKPSLFVKELSAIEFSKISDSLSEYPGFYVAARYLRGYPHQSMANTLGYIGEVSKYLLENQKGNYYKSGDYIGISGLEANYEKDIRGRRGSKYIMVNVKGVQKGSFKKGKFDTLSIGGNDFITTVDLALQQYGEKLMTRKIGSIVAIEPSTGEILAIVSTPSYDPNLLTGKKLPKNFSSLQEDTLHPLFNRALMAMYPPGSIFKMVQGLIALQEKLISPYTIFPCTKSLVKCHNHPEPTNLDGALEYSCNPYFYYVFRKIIQQNRSANPFKDTEFGLEKWREYVKSFGFGEKLGVDLPNEKPGIIASGNYYNKLYGKGRWKFSMIYSLAIGQGEIGVIPIQMANLAAIIANKGYYYTPHLGKEIGENKTIDSSYVRKHYTKIDSIYFNFIIRSMEKAVESGTAQNAYIKSIAICGKTGTVQNPHGEDHSCFIAFAPKKNPKIAIAVYVENSGAGASWAAPIASLMIEKYLTNQITRPELESYIINANLLLESKRKRKIQP